jgi:hypothetical protein
LRRGLSPATTCDHLAVLTHHRHSIACSRIHLHFGRTGVIHVVTAVITANGDNMNTSIAEETTGTAQAIATGDQPKSNKKANVARQRAHVAPKKAKSAKKARSPKRAPKSQKKATSVRDGSKTAKVLDLLKRPGGATVKDLMKATGWQPHSVRGFLSGTVGKKMGLAVTSTKTEDGERTYSVKA